MVFPQSLGRVLWSSAVQRTRKMALCAALLGVAVLGGCVLGAPYAKSDRSSWQLFQSAISPDGGEIVIVYTDRRRRQGDRVYILDTASGSQRRMPLPAHINWSNPSFHPLDPDRILLTARCIERSVCPDSDIGVRLYDVRLSTGEARPLTPPFERGKWEVGVSASTYNADGTKIASVTYDIIESPYVEDQIRVVPNTVELGISIIDVSTGSINKIFPTRDIPYSFQILSAPEFVSDSILMLRGGAEKDHRTGESVVVSDTYPIKLSLDKRTLSKVPIRDGALLSVADMKYIAPDRQILFLAHPRSKKTNKNRRYIYELFLSDEMADQQITSLNLPIGHISYANITKMAILQILASGPRYYEPRFIFVNTVSGAVRSVELSEPTM